MIERSATVKPIDVKRGEHLREGVQPIIACVGFGTKEDFEKGVSPEAILHSHHVDFYGETEELRKSGFENDGQDSYVISPIDSFSKYSKEFYNCTGLIIAGTEKRSSENVSFMTHQNPEYFLEKDDQKFSESLIKNIRAIKDKCEDKTIDAVVFGGRYAEVKGLDKSDTDRNMFIEEYLKSIKFLSEKVQSELGFEPLVLTGPKNMPASDCVFYDNDMRRLYLMRGQNEFDFVQNFTPSELEERRKNWKPGEWPLPISPF